MANGFILVSMVTDRTRADADYAEMLEKLGWEKMTESQKIEWLAGLKGAYNASDLNRVEAAVEYLQTQFNEIGFAFHLVTKTDWDDGMESDVPDIPTVRDMERYLGNVKALRDRPGGATSALELPENMRKRFFYHANNIEQLLLDLEAAIERIRQIFVPCGVYHSGAVMYFAN